MSSPETFPYRDNYNCLVEDQTEELRSMSLLCIDYKRLVRVERKEENVLMLFRRGVAWDILYWCLSGKNAALNGAASNELTHWKRAELDPNVSLFKQINLF